MKPRLGIIWELQTFQRFNSDDTSQIHSTLHFKFNFDVYSCLPSPFMIMIGSPQQLIINSTVLDCLKSPTPQDPVKILFRCPPFANPLLHWPIWTNTREFKSLYLIGGSHEQTGYTRALGCVKSCRLPERSQGHRGPCCHGSSSLLDHEHQ